MNEIETVQIIGAKLDSLKNELNDQKAILRELSVSLTLLAKVEERQANTSAALDRAFLAIEKLDLRLQAAENKLPAFSQTAMWVERAIIALVAIVGTYIAKQTGLI